MELICNLYFKLGRGRSLLARVSSQKLSLYSVFCIRRRSVIQGCNAASSLPALHPSLPLEVGPLNAARGLGSAVSSPSGVWGRAQAEIEFGAF